MKIEQRVWYPGSGWDLPTVSLAEAQLVLLFGDTYSLKSEGVLERICADYSQALLLGCSTAGEIQDTRVLDGHIVLTALAFDRCPLRFAEVELSHTGTSYDAGRFLADSLPHQIEQKSEVLKLRHVFVLSDGLQVNGSELVSGLTSGLPETVTITGGLAADGARFAETLIFTRTGLRSEALGAVGFYGDRVCIGFGSLGGWDPFGPERLITRSSGNVLYELDGQPALDLYRQYLGEHSRDLPSSGLLFPLSIRTQDTGASVVRTILAIDDQKRSMTFAGDIPEGAYARLMKANTDRLIDGAVGAARTSSSGGGKVSPDLALLISCVGRKLVLHQRVEEEVEGVRDVLGSESKLTGFYSYGEISPFASGAKCELHNQTMTITTFSES